MSQASGLVRCRTVACLYVGPFLCVYFACMCVCLSLCVPVWEGIENTAHLTRTRSNHSNHLPRALITTRITLLELNTTKTQHDCAGISTGPFRRAGADVINGVRWIMSILRDWTEPAESLKVREEHIADCFPKTGH